MQGTTERILAGAALAIVFGALAILNSGGYRYGASDQAFYVPAMMRQADPSLFPRDRDLLAAQDRMMLVDDVLGRLAAGTGVRFEHLLFAGYLLTLAGLAAAGWTFGRALLETPWGAAAFVIALTIRHRVPKTGVNTLEPYFHPRIVAFAVGVTGLAALVRGRPWLALGLAAAAGALHPTTGLWFGIVALAGVWVIERRARSAVTALGLAAALGVTVLIAGGRVHERLVVMDQEWLAILAAKDYLFPTEWEFNVWLQHLLYVAVVAVTVRTRWRRGLLGRGETALLVGLALLLGLVLLSLPFVHARVALAVQLQVSRAMWLFDLVAIVYAAWWIVEARPLGAGPVRRRRWAVALVALLSLARGTYIMLVEREGHPVFQVTLPPDEWQAAMHWIDRQPLDAHVLTDPGHAWRFGSSVRLAARRDVFLEEVKDAALAIYSRDVALRVLARTRALGDYRQLTPAHARALGRRFDIDFLVTDARLDLPVAYQNARFRVYRIDGSPGGG